MQTQGRGEVTSAPPGGYVKVEIEGRAANVVAVPLRKRGAFTGRIVESGSNQLSFSQTGWETNQFGAAEGKPRFYAEVVTGSLVGVYFPIVANTVDTLTLEVGGHDLTAAFPGLGTLKADTVGEGSSSPGDLIRVRPAWTLSELFGGNGEILDEFADAAAAAPYNGGDRIFVPDDEGVGFRKAPKYTLSYIANSGWRDIADLNVDHGDTAMLPGKPVIVHRNAAEGRDLVVVGYPKLDRSALWVPGSSTELANLAYAASVFSEPLSLEESGLSDPGAEIIEDSLSLAQNGDELFLYNGSRGGPFAPPEQRFVNLSSGGWRERGSDSTTVGEAEALLPGRGFGILKSPGKVGRYWISLPGYLSPE